MEDPASARSWRAPVRRTVAHVLWSLPLSIGKWRVAHYLADLLVDPTIPEHRTARIAAGFKMSLDLCDVMQRRIYLAGTYDPRTTRLFQQILRPGDSIVDGGANIGYFSLLAATRVGVHGSIHAFEPIPRTFAALGENIRLNGFSTIRASCLALGQARGQMILEVPEVTHSGGAVAVGGTMCPGVTFGADAEESGRAGNWIVCARQDSVDVMLPQTAGGGVVRQLLGEPEPNPLAPFPRTGRGSGGR